MSSTRSNNSFKPNLLRSTNYVAEKSCHAIGSATQVGLTQALGLTTIMLDPEKILSGARSTVTFNPRDLVRELVAYGEIDAADKLLRLDQQAIAAIGVLASRHYSAPDRPILDKAICLGIVEFLEEQVRPLKRKRRFYAKAGGVGEA